MSGTTDDNLGRRLFQVQKEKAVEDALEKMRRGMGAEWNSVSSADSEILKEVLGEVWTSLDRHRWGTYSFSKLSKKEIISLISIGKEMKTKRMMSEDTLKLLDNLLSHTI